VQFHISRAPEAMRALLDPSFDPERRVSQRPRARPKFEQPAVGKLGLARRRLLADAELAASAPALPLLRKKGAAMPPDDLFEARRTIWKSDIKGWLARRNRGADWELPVAHDHLLGSWFDQIDLDKSGAVRRRSPSARRLGEGCS